MPAGSISVRVADARDRFLISGWLGANKGEIWTGSRAAMEAAISLALADPAANPRIAERDGKPWAYMHSLEIPVDPRAGGSVPVGTRWLDVVTSAPLGRDTHDAATLLGDYAQEIFQTTLTPALGALVAMKQEQIVRCFERAGFSWLAIADERGFGPVWLLLRQRP